jgi:hypothetical protein
MRLLDAVLQSAVEFLPLTDLLARVRLDDNLFGDRNETTEERNQNRTAPKGKG